MGNTSDTMRAMDATIATALASAGLEDKLTTAAGVEVLGYFNRSYQPALGGDEEAQGEFSSFDCRADEWPQAVAEDEAVTIAGAGTFRYLWRQQHGIGRTLVVLGSLLP